MSCDQLTAFEACKDPEEVLDYTINYEVLLLASVVPDSIASSVWTATGALNIDSSSFTGINTTVWVSGGGILGSRCKLINTVTTAGGRTYERTIMVTVANK